MIRKDVSFLSLDIQFILHLWASFHSKYGHKDKVLFESQKCEKIGSSPLSIFLTINMFQFELHPHIGEICTDILVYEERCGNKIHLSTRKSQSWPSWFVTKLNAWWCGIGSNIFLKTGITVVCLSLSVWHNSEYHNNKGKKCLTTSAIPHHHGLL